MSIIAVIITAAVCAVLIIYIAEMKKQLRIISSELDRTAAPTYNRLVNVSLFDRDINALAASVNRCIEHQKELKLKAELAEESLRQSVSDIAHDLRTPLSVIKGNLQLIGMGTELSDNYRNYLDVCIEKTDVLKNMSDDFFELALLESDGAAAEIAEINITNTLMKFVADNEGYIRMSHLDPDIVLPPKPVRALADETMLIRILSNLLSNTAKYSSGDMKMILSADPVCTITFENTVSGGNLPDTEHIFDRSYRAGRTNGRKSAGLGLYIVKLLAERMDGSVSADIIGGVLKISVMLKNCE